MPDKKKDNKGRSDRRAARADAFRLVFARSFDGETPADELRLNMLLTGMISDPGKGDVADDAVVRLPETYPFTGSLFDAYLSDPDGTDRLISEALKGWRLERLSAVSRSALRLAVTELRFFDTPTAVVINEAVELCKTYGDPKDASYVNGVLRTVSDKLKSGQ